MRDTTPSFGSPGPTPVPQPSVEEILKRFEKAWQQGLAPPAIEDYASSDLPDRHALLVELVHIDLEFRLKAGEPARVEPYLRRYPDLQRDHGVLVELLAAEYKLRGRTAAAPELGEYRKRFPEQFASLQQQLIQDTSRELAASPPRPDEPVPAALPAIDGYEVLRELGQGGMGVVYEARQLGLDRRVALKMVRAGALASTEDLRRFRQEGEAVARLDHPHIVPVYDVGEHDGQPYFTMKLVEGGTLGAAMAAGKWPAGTAEGQRAAARLVATVARAVHHAHQRGILHRDLKPANILLSRTSSEEPRIEDRGSRIEKQLRDPRSSILDPRSSILDPHLTRPMVTDFGLALRLDGDARATVPGQILGTPCYMAPEQAAGAAPTTACDVYGLGTTLYELVTGRPPFLADTPLATLAQVREVEPTPPRRLNPEISIDLETICLKCLAKDPRLRYGSAEALAEDVERWLRGEPIQARPVGPLERLLKWARRRPGAAALLGLVFLVAALGFAGVFWQWRQTEAQRQLTDEARDDAERRRQEAEAGWKEAEARRQEGVHRQYVMSILLAARDWETSDTDRARHWLGQCPPELRQWEWHHLDGLCRVARLSVRGRWGGLTQVAFHPDGKQLAVAGGGWLQVWDVAGGRELFAVESALRSTLALAYRPDGRHIALAGQHAQLEVRNAATGAVVWQARPPSGALLSVAYSPDGAQFTTAGSDNYLRSWDAATGKPLRAIEAHTRAVTAVAYSADGTLLGSGSEDGVVRTWDAATGAPKLTFRGHQRSVLGVVFSPRGDLLLSADGGPEYGRTPLGLFPFAAQAGWGVHPVALSPNGQRLVMAGADKGLRYWHPITGRSMRSVAGRMDTLADRSVALWDISGGYQRRSLQGHPHVVTGVAFSPDGRHVASVSQDGIVKVWDAPEDQDPILVRPRNRFGARTAFLPDGGLLEWSDNAAGVQVHDVMIPGKRPLLLRGHDKPVRDLAVHPQGKILATASDDKTVRTWDMTTGDPLQVCRGHDAGVSLVTFSPDGRRLASRARNGELKLWDMATGSLLRTLAAPATQASRLLFSPDGEYMALVGTNPGLLAVWECESGKEVLPSQEGEMRSLAAAFAPDGLLALAASNGDIRLVDVGTGKERLRLQGHSGGVTSLAFHPHQQRLASASSDRTVRLWDTARGQEQLKLRVPTVHAEDLAFSADGSRLISVARDGAICFWDGMPQK